nr:hypothetical protein [uncultured Sphingobacterium sp.]
MENVYLLWHTHIDKNLDGGEDIKLIGVYSSELLAEEALKRKSTEKGFKDHLEGFEISRYILDHDAWSSGFVTE